MKAGEEQGQRGSQQPPGTEEPRGSEGILGARQTCQALGSALGETQQPSHQPQSFSWF